MREEIQHGVNRADYLLEEIAGVVLSAEFAEVSVIFAGIIHFKFYSDFAAFFLNLGALYSVNREPVIEISALIGFLIKIRREIPVVIADLIDSLIILRLHH